VNKPIYRLGLASIIIFIIFIRLWKLSTIPRGLYVDETSIGLNAALISETGHDEHGKLLPIYFEAFGEYKNPLYIYATALIFKIIGVSVFNLRLTSFIFISVFLWGLYLLTKNLFKNETVTLYALLAGGTLPWFFNLSRMAFEVISQPAVIIFCLYFVYKIYSKENKHLILYPLLLGLLIALSVYSFTTARLLSFLLFISVIIIYYKRIEKNLILTAGFFIGIIPYLSFYFSDPSKLTERFRVVTYIYNVRLSVYEKISEFFTNYFHYLSPDYLFIRGDTLLRHHNQYGGELYLSVLILSIFGLGWLIFKKKMDKFSTFLFINLLLSPVAAALTTGDSSLRSILVGLYLLIFSAYGLYFLLKLPLKKTKLIISTLLAFLLIFEISGYLKNYFFIYPSKSIYAFESYNFPDSLQLAIDKNPKDIVVSNAAYEPYTHLQFYEKSMNLKTNIPITIGPPIAESNRCIIYFSWANAILNENLYRVEQLGDVTNVTQLKCFY